MELQDQTFKRLHRVFDYLDDLHNHTRKIYWDVQTDHSSFYHYGSSLFELDNSELPESHKGLLFHTEDEEGQSIWLEVPRLDPIGPPQLPHVLEPWIKPSHNPHQEPVIQESISQFLGDFTDEQKDLLDLNDVNQESEEAKTFLLSNHSRLQKTVKTYQEQWQRWAQVEQKRWRIINLYRRLFQQAHDIEETSSDSPLELVVGIGVATWSNSNQRTLRYPLITKAVEIEREDTTQALRLRPRDRAPEIEIDPFRELECPGVAEFEEEAQIYLDEHRYEINPFEEDTFVNWLRKAAGRFSDQGSYLPDNSEAVESDETTVEGSIRPWSKVPQPIDKLQICDDWVLFIRRRSSSVFTQDIKRFRKRLSQSEDDPTLDPGPVARALVEVPEEIPAGKIQPYRGLSTTSAPGQDQDVAEARELYFPLSYNDEQVAIIQGLDRAEGVVVQGPPGTGKTHTISNIICHYLATGRRVLITSDRDPALRVIQDHLPQTVRPFAINLSASDREGLKELEGAVRTLASDVSQFDVGELTERIQVLEQQIDNQHRNLSQLNHELETVARDQIQEVHFFGEDLNPLDLAEKVIRQQSAHDWFLDAVPTDSDPNLLNESVDHLRELRLELGKDLVYLDHTLPDPMELPEAQEVGQIHEDLMNAENIRIQQEAGDLPPLIDTRPETREKAQTLRDRLQHFREIQSEVDTNWKHALREAYRQYHEGQPNDFPVGAFDTLLNKLIALREERKDLLQHWIDIPDEWQRIEGLRETVNKACNKGALPWNPLRPRALKKALAEILVDQDVPSSGPDWCLVLAYMDLLSRAQSLGQHWNTLIGDLEGPEVTVGSSQLVRELPRFANTCEAIRELGLKLDGEIPSRLAEIVPRGFPTNELVGDNQRVDEALDILNRHLQRGRLEWSQDALRDHRKRLQGTSGPVADQLVDLLNNQVGDPDRSRANLESQWERLVGEVRHLQDQQPKLAEVKSITQQIAEQGAHEWARKLRNEIVTGKTDPWLPGNWQESWEWSRANVYLRSIDTRDRLRNITQQRHQGEARLRDLYAEITEQRVKRALKQNLSSSVRAALEQYLDNIKRIGKGTGKRAPRYRQEARKALQRAYQAVPCWIMPHARVSEALPSEIGNFDLVIVDEASQSNVWSIPSLLRGKQVLVVGDDKQVSPAPTMLKETNINHLLTRHLGELPNGGSFTPERSLYDMAKVFFPKSPIVLREHFRCVLPIIEFSNRLAYHGKMIPLRVPKPSDRIDPPLVDVYITDGYRQRDINPPEADAIISEIQRLQADPRLKHRTIGVISLVGHEQTHWIHNRLAQELGEDLLAKGQIRCGDARHFQGSEADIVILSMVHDDQRARAMRDPDTEQRYNVAVSRARDRLYLFRSISRNKLQNDDLRARLIDYVKNPGLESSTHDGDLAERFDSPMERELFDDLIASGYRVTSQFPAGRHRIDLVVEGDNDQRLAIELDGDKYHPPEQWMKDVQRQRVLERVGWTFWRCFASTYRAHKQEMLEDLFSRLRELGIEPSRGCGDAAPKSISEQWVLSSKELADNSETDSEVVEVEPNFASDTPSTVSVESTQTKFSQASLGGVDSQTFAVDDSPDLESSSEVSGEESVRTSSLPQGEWPYVEPEDRVTYLEFSENGESIRHQALISSSQSDPNSGILNVRVPIAQALLDGEEGDKVEAHLPRGTKLLLIEKIEKPSSYFKANQEQR